MARIRDVQENGKLIEVFAEVALPAKNGDNNSQKSGQPFILRTYPPDYANKEILNRIPDFAYPCKFKCDVITHFSFVLTNITSKWTFGYCRHTPNSDTCLAILSDLPWHCTFYRILDHCAELMNRPSSVSLDNFMQALYHNDVPLPGLEMSVTYTMEDLRLREFQAQCPDHLKLPSLPDDRNLSEYFNAVSANNMIEIFASMLNERRIVITSDRLNRLSSCVQAANALIFPMHWQHIFIPLLPSNLLDYLSAPMPFLVGVPSETLKTVKRNEIGEIVLFNADTNELSTPFEDVSTLPSEVVNNLRKALKQSNSELGDGLARSFLRALVSLIGGYHEALQMQPGKLIAFDRDKFVSSVRGTSRQLFLERILHLQLFQQFIETRLEYLNRGESYIDEFELEVKEHYTNSSFRSQYKEWTAAMKKEGGALLRAVNPKVKSAISLSRQAVRNLRSKMQSSSSGPQINYNGHHRPTSAPTSPKQPPKMKKSISGTALGQQPTNGGGGHQAVIGYVRDSPASMAKGSLTPSRSSNLVSSTNNSKFHLPLARNPLEQQSSIDSNSLRVDMNITEELESIFRKKLPVTRTTNKGFESAKNSDPIIPPLPPPRTDKLKLSLSPPTATCQPQHSRGGEAIKCLIEFDSPPKEMASERKATSFGSLDASVFDPLYADDTLIENNNAAISTNTPASPQRYTNVNNSKAFANFWETNNNFINMSGHGNGHNVANTFSNLNSSAPTYGRGLVSNCNTDSHYQHLSYMNTPGLPTSPISSFDLLSLQARNSKPTVARAPPQQQQPAAAAENQVTQSKQVNGGSNNHFVVNHRWQQFD